MVQLLEKKKESSPVLSSSSIAMARETLHRGRRTTISALAYLKNILELDPRTSSPWRSSSTTQLPAEEPPGGDGYRRR